MDNINLMLSVAVVLDLRYRLKYVKFWFKEGYGKDKGDAMSSKVRDAMSSKVVVLHCLGTPQVLAMQCFIV